jgi:hypothetical protein
VQQGELKINAVIYRSEARLSICLAVVPRCSACKEAIKAYLPVRMRIKKHTDGKHRGIKSAKNHQPIPSKGSPYTEQN